VFDASKEHNDFTVDWYSKHLKAMKEPSLWKLSEKGRSTTVYRLLWLPTFDHPVSVRLVRRSEGAVLYAVLLDGRGGYEPGKIKVNKCKTINGKQWNEFQRLLDKVKLWEMPTELHRLDGCDGDQVILEAVSAGKYHVVDRWSPDREDEYAKLCRYLLTLSGLDVLKAWDPDPE
jgi:hypothetical protein